MNKDIGPVAPMTTREIEQMLSDALVAEVRVKRYRWARFFGHKRAPRMRDYFARTLGR
jgi:hypothetical protein